MPDTDTLYDTKLWYGTFLVNDIYLIQKYSFCGCLGELVNSCYGPGETYDSKFTTIASSYEECRAECAGLHLCLVPGVNQIFGYSPDQGRED